MAEIPKKAERKKVVLVEDDALMSDVLARNLESEGLTVVRVTDGTQVFDRVAAEQPALVLLDIILPGANGFDILERLKREAPTRAIPVLVLSNLGSKEEIQRGLELGAEGYLVKANSLVEEITAKVKEVLGRRKGP